MKKLILAALLSITANFSFSQIVDEKEEYKNATPDPDEKTVEVEIDFIRPEHLNFCSIDLIPVHLDWKRSNLSLGALLSSTAVINSNLLFEMSIGKAYSDELASNSSPSVNDRGLTNPNWNLANDWSVSVYKERSAFQWHGSGFISMSKKTKAVKQTIKFKEIGNTHYVTEVPSKKLIALGPRIGAGYWAGHIENVFGLFKGIQVSEGHQMPYRKAARSQLDYSYASVGFQRAAFQNSRYLFTKYGPKTLKSVKVIYLDYIRALSYNLDNIIMVDTEDPGLPKVEYNLQDLTPFNKNGVRLGYKSLGNDGGLLTTTLGAEVGIKPGVGVEVFYWLYAGLGINLIK